MESIWHIGFVVPGLEKGKKELGDVFGLGWRPTRVRKLTLVDADGRPYDVECHVAFSLGGPFAVEVWQAIPGTPLDIPESGGVHAPVRQALERLAFDVVAGQLTVPVQRTYVLADVPRALADFAAGSCGKLAITVA